MSKFMNNVNFGKTVKQNKESYKFYIGENCYCVYRPLSGKANEHRISNGGTQVYTIENCLLDYFGDSPDIVNERGEYIFEQKSKIGDVFCYIDSPATSYTIVFNDENHKYGLLAENKTVFGCKYASIEELIAEEFPSHLYMKKEC